MKNSFMKWFKKSSDPQIVDEINIETINNLHRFSIIVVILETISLLLYVFTNRNAPNFMHTFINVAFCVVACVFAAVLSKIIIKEYKNTGAISDTLSTIMVSAFYLLLSVWGTIVDAAHYQNGEQMITFYIVQFCILCFIVMKPRIGSILILSSFTFFFVKLCTIDGAVKMQPQNFIIFVLIAILGNAIKYTMQHESVKNKMEVLELNEVLQREATIDDLTKLKNRNALNREMKEYIGKPICINMVDIDDFKKYNDTYGHLVGDEVLSSVAASITKMFPDDGAYRYGGDEFLIILCDCSKEECKKKTSKWAQTVQSIEIKNVPSVITCSSGFSYGIPKSIEECKRIIKEADDKLYEIKVNKNTLR